MLEYETLSWYSLTQKVDCAAWDFRAMPMMDAKRDAELNKDGEGETQTAQLPSCVSDFCSTPAHEDGEKQNPPGSPLFPSKFTSHRVHSQWLIWIGSYILFSHSGIKVRVH